MAKDLKKPTYQKVEVDINKYNVPNLDAIGKICGIFQRMDGTGDKVVVGTTGAIGLNGKEKKLVSKSQVRRLQSMASKKIKSKKGK